MIKISTIKQIMENESLKIKLEQIQTEEEFKRLFMEYDFSGLREEELNADNLMAVSAGLNITEIKPADHPWLHKLLERLKSQK